MASPETGMPGIEEVEGGQETKAEKPEGAREEGPKDPDAKALQEIGGEQHDVLRLQDRAERVAVQAKEVEAQIKDVRADLGLPPQEVPSETARSLVDIEKRLDAKDAALDAKQKEFLGVPEGEPVEQASADEVLEQMEEAERDLEKEQADMEKRRDKAQKYIDGLDGWIREKFGDLFDKSVNGKKAEKLLSLKVKTGMTFAAERYIESGKVEDHKEMAGVVTVDTKKVEDANGDTQTYISVLDVEMGSEAVKAYLQAKGEKTGEDQLLKDKEKQDLRQAEQEGRVKDEKKT